jgi:indoleamine 2,3-dioxygenase
MKEIALFRDYCFLASAYLLENCHHTWLQTGNSYGLGRDHIPKSIAKPLVKLATKLNFRPFLEYNSGYSLNNWYRIDKTKEIALPNIEILRSFINMKAESGFILVHVSINQHSGRLVQSGIEVLNAVEHNDREAFNEALGDMRNVMVYMNQELSRMYYESNPEHYNIFRTFIMGILNQPMFPNGVVYEDCFDNQPQYYRGESGANDSIIPFCDNILQITQFLPKNPLTDILRDFRSYRPKEHQEFLTWTENVSKRLGVLEYARQNPESMVLLLEVADQVRAFRHTHWVLTNLYIIRKSTHPVATGGSPITTWLPNQLLTVIEFIKNNAKYAMEGEIPSNLQYSLNAIVTRADSDETIIKRQTEESRKLFKQ